MSGKKECGNWKYGLEKKGNSEEAWTLSRWETITDGNLKNKKEWRTK
jgi:hypothetical protein